MTAAQGGLPSNAVLWLAHASGPPAKLTALEHGAEPLRWIFLGRNYLELLAWERALGPGFPRVPVDRLLEQTANRLRQPFLDLITNLGRRHACLAWWTSRVSERNTMVSPLFLHCCYVRVGLGFIERGPVSLCFVSESWAVLRCLASEARRHGRPVHWVTQSLPAWQVHLKRCARMSKNAWGFLRDGVRQSRAARRIRAAATDDPTPEDRPCILLRTFVDEACLHEDGTFHDRQLPGLSTWLEQQGYNVWTIPVLFNVKRSYRATWEWLRRSRQRFLNPDEYFRLSDLVFTLCVALRQLSMPKGRTALDSVDVTQLFDENRLQSAFDHSTLPWILISRLPRRLKQAGFRASLLIQGFENMIPEKGAIWGFRRSFPGMKIVGFQHSVPSPMLLSQFVSAGEAEHAPLPDRVVCNGKLFCEILIRAGLEPERVVEGPALRFAHLWQAQSTPGSTRDGHPCVLVAVPLELGSAVELLSKVLRALGEAQRLPVRVKPHPMMNPDDLLRQCGLAALPAHFEFVRGTVGTWLRRARVVVSAGSAVLLEALTAGVPVVTVGRESGLNLNPLAWLAGQQRVCHCPEEIRVEVLRMWNLSTGQRSAYRRRGQAALRTSFNPVTEDKLDVFVGGLAAPGSD